MDLIPEPEPVDRIDTQFGGVFYLVNLALYMEVYGDFTRPADPGLSLVLWDFLALLGLELCGPEITADPIWDFLAHLSSRDPADPPGAGWTAPDGSSAGEWISAFAVGASERLRLALGLSESDDPGRFLCRHTATVMATATHLHIYLSLATLPISIRYAGLDRDPGWVPAGGLYIAFHFD